MKNLYVIFIYFATIVALFSYDYDSTKFSITDGKVTDKTTNAVSYAVKGSQDITSNYYGETKRRTINTDGLIFPKFNSSDPLIDALYLLAIEEAYLDINKDGYFAAGEKWNQAWTRDMSYAIYLSLGFLLNDISTKSLETRIDNGLILQDTGTGGSYPISSDRIVWAMAAYETALCSKDAVFYKKVYDTIKNSVMQDLKTNFCPNNALFRGEESFLDWREQTYPIWMEPVNIGDSFALNVNVLYYKAFKILEIMSKKLEITGEADIWNKYSTNLKESIVNNFWIENRDYFGAYIIDGAYPYIYDGYETLGESLAITSGLVSEEKSYLVLNAVAPSDYGAPVVAPQLTGISPYHNDAIWPFVQAYRGLAAKKAGDIKTLEFEFATTIRSAAHFLTFKENLVATTGDSAGTAINSDRQLWSVAGYLSFIYRVILGMSFSEEGLSLNPVIFDSMKNGAVLEGFSYKDSILTVKITGTGDKISAYYFDGKVVPADFIIPQDTKGEHNIQIELVNASKIFEPITPKYDAATYAPQIPYPVLDIYKNKYYIEWNQKNQNGFKLFRNGAYQTTIYDGSYELKPEDKAVEYFLTSDSGNLPALKGTPIWIESAKNAFFVEAERMKFTGGEILAKNISNVKKTNAKLSFYLDKSTYNSSGYIGNWGKKLGDYINFVFNVKKSGKYTLDIRYQNGNGAVNTGERSAIRSSFIDCKQTRALYFPQRGSWMDWGFTSPLVIELEKGKHTFQILNDENCYSQKKRLVKINVDLLRVREIE